VPLNIIDSFEKTIVRAEMRNGRQLGGRRHVIAPLVSGAGSLVFRSLPPELPSADVRPRIGPVAAISTDRRVARLFREPSIMRSSQCTERALSRRNAVR
jgi:hypothetical protein